MSFKNLGLRPELLAAISARGYKEATPVQAQAIPVVLEGHDVMAGAQTGTGKTAAFSLPIIQLLCNKVAKGRQPRALVLTPTRELAAQVLEFTEEYGKQLHLRAMSVFGGVSINPQIMTLKKGVDILIATPGRLLDHVRQRTLDLSHIEILVLDEADRMLDMGFINDIRKVIKEVPKNRQTLFFSATYTPEIKQLSETILRSPKLIEVATRNTTADNVCQVVHPVAYKRKTEMLSKLMREGDWKQTLVFTRTKHGANKLVKALIADGITALAIHGNKSQGARTKALADFKKGAVRVLCATDIAARGLDINLLPHVVNFDLPDVPECYVHRIGRTGRAGADGKAISLVCLEEQKELRAIQRMLKKDLPVEYIKGFDITAAEEADARKRAMEPRRGGRNFSSKSSGRSYGQGGNRGGQSSGYKKSPSRSGGSSSKKSSDASKSGNRSYGGYAGKSSGTSGSAQKRSFVGRRASSGR